MASTSSRGAQDDAVATLRRIAFLLERAQATSYRSDAFRVAARTIAGTDPDRFHELAGAGRLRELPAVGERTASVVETRLRGEPVDYLDTLEAELSNSTASEPAAALRAALRGDLHAHTNASDGNSPLPEMALAAIDLGHDYLAITDHSPRLTIANGLTAARLRTQLDQVAALNAALLSAGTEFRVLTGIEVDILEDGSLDQDPELLAELDAVVASVHSLLRMESAPMTQRLLTALADPNTDVLGHCTGRQLTGKLRPPSTFDPEAVFSACAEHGVAVEINCRPDRLDPPHALLERAVEAGCEFTIDTDAHAPGQLDWQQVGCDRAAMHGLAPGRVRNTLAREDLLDRHRRGHR